jgi:hypothetical protein
MRTLTLCLLGLLTLPAVAFAAPKDFKGFVEFLLQIIQNAVVILFAALSVGLVYGVALYMINGDEEKKRADLRPYLMWSIIGIAVVFGMWGFVAILQGTFFSGASIGIPFLTPPA